MNFRLWMCLACVLVALVSTVHADDDRVRASLVRAIAVYESRLEHHRTAVAAWFDRREEAARKIGNKEAIDQLKAERQAFAARGELPKTVPGALKSRLALARTALETAYKTAIRNYTKQRMDDEAAAVEKKLETFKQGDFSGAVASRRPVHIAGGDWRGDYRLENGEFIQAKTGHSKIIFGGSDWSDYDLSVETMTLTGVESGHLALGCTENGHEHYIFYLKNSAGQAAIYGNIQGQKKEMAPPVKLNTERNRWYKIDVRTRGPHLRVSVDGQLRFALKGDAPARGYIGFNTYGSSVKWRNLTINAPDGSRLWEGFPEVNP